ncbi:acylphosphatase [Puerhibacterium sp. TATVAM-FAB25]|uniref:acylphosphatase n=1 Tax=Puerhibacterium sp. TATVAM-FAB25 TaxID=3093699 RepID=UPI00397A713D
MARRRVRAVVRGIVQGVGFRAAVEDAADGLGVSGWVRNTVEGTVEVEVEGDGGAVEAMLAFLREGPRAARVTGVELRDVALQHEAGFHVTG